MTPEQIIKTPWTRAQKITLLSSFLGWTFDAFDFFLMVFVLTDIAKTFATSLTSVTIALTLTLAFRPVGALIFGHLADKFGRKKLLMTNILLYSIIEFCSGLSPNLYTFLILRSLFGIAMGGEWGIGAALVMESIPERSRGWVSGFLQSGYSFGYLLAAIVFGLLYTHLGWRGMFFIAIIPALFILVIRQYVPDSPVPKQSALQRTKSSSFVGLCKQNFTLILFGIILMAVFNVLAHGSQDLYPTFLRGQLHLDVHSVSLLTIVLNIGAIMGAILFGMLSEKWGRRKSMFLGFLLALLVSPLWIYGSNIFLMLIGVFGIGLGIQGAFGVIPVYLNEIAPSSMRATFSGTVYQIGNLIASVTAIIQTHIALAYGGNFGIALLAAVIPFAIIAMILIQFGPEKKGARLHTHI